MSFPQHDLRHFDKLRIDVAKTIEHFKCAGHLESVYPLSEINRDLLYMNDLLLSKWILI